MERYHMFKLGLAILFYAAYCIRPMSVNALQTSHAEDQQNGTRPRQNPEELVFYQGVEGTPGIDFPIYAHIPRTAFSCKGIESGYYADLDTDCQVFHICEEEKKISFLCPNGTIFQQSELICEWWFKVNCTDAPGLYAESAENLRNDIARRKSFRKVHLNGNETPHGAIMRTEEASSISAKRNGQEISTRKEARRNNHRNSVPDPIAINGIVNGEKKSRVEAQQQQQPASHLKSRRYNDDQTGNFINNNYEGSTRAPSSKTRSRQGVNTNSNKERHNNSPLNQRQNVGTDSNGGRNVKSPSYSVRGDSRFLNEGNQVKSPSKSEEGVSTNARYNDQSYLSSRGNGGTRANNDVAQPNGGTNSNNEYYQPSSNLRGNGGTKSNEGKVQPSSSSKQNEGINSNANEYVQLSASLRQNGGSKSTKEFVQPSSSSIQTGSTNSNTNEYVQLSASSRLNGGTKSNKEFVSNSRQNGATNSNNEYVRLSASSRQKSDSTNPSKEYNVQSTIYSGRDTSSTLFNGENQVQSNVKQGANPNIKYSNDQSSSNLGQNSITNSRQGANAHSIKEYHVQFASTSPGVDQPFGTRTTAAPPKVIQTERPSSEYELEFPTHRSASNNQEQNESDEAQITQESASFVKNSLNSIHDDGKKFTGNNPYPNHRTTYSDLKTPSYGNVKTSTTISSVTPQYITTQPINNGRPFLGSRVGTNLHTSIGTVPVQSSPQVTTSSYYFNQEKPKSKSRPFSKIDEESKKTAKVLLEQTRSGGAITANPLTVTPQEENGEGTRSFNDDFTVISAYSSTSAPFTSASTTYRPYTSPATPRVATTTRRPIDHATIYGTFTRNSATTPAPSNFNRIKQNQTPERISLQLSTTLSGNQDDRVRISAGIPVILDKHKIAASISNQLQVPSDKPIQKSTTSIRPFVSAVPTAPSKYSHSANLLKLDAFVRAGDIDTIPKPTTTPPIYSGFNGSSYLPLRTTKNTAAGFFVTKNSVSTTPATRPDKKQRPRPFQKYNPVDNTITPTYANYKVSSASPFMVPSGTNIIPTQPTPYSKPITSVYENVDNMINVLMNIVKDPDYSSETPRPGLVIPPSVGPQTLHTLAVYFANALDGATKEKGEKAEAMKEKLTTLLTQMTVHGYNNLFKKEHETQVDSSTEIPTTVTPDDESSSNGLETQSSHNLAQTPEIRELARNFSIALSSYLSDPESFRKDLEELRPTEPTLLEDNQADQDELLNFSDADIKDLKPNLPPIFPTSAPAPSPTWGYIFAPKPTNEDVKNSINPDLSTADSQSFIPSYNDLSIGESFNEQKRKVPTTELPDFNDVDYSEQRQKTTTTELPKDHWTSSPNATNLWKNTFSVNPVVVNGHFETTPIAPSGDGDITEPTPTEHLELPHTELDYQLKTLPKLTLNSTQIHGILIDFMNKTSPDSERLHRILKRLNTTENEFLTKMREIEMNPLTKRLILLLISECGVNAAQDIETAISEESQEESAQVEVQEHKSNSYIPELVSPILREDDQDTRALQLLNTLYHIASKFGK